MHLSEAAISASDLVLGYGATVALSRSTFEVPAGRVTAIIGPNGSGKSTVLNAIAGLLEPMSGSIDVPARADGSHRISYVLQTTKVNDALPISVREVVTMGRYASAGGYGRLGPEDRAAVAGAMKRTGIRGLAGRRLQHLSGGQRQRVFVAQGLAQDHDLLLLDEPLTGIDLPTAQAIDAVIHDELTRGCTVVLTTHDLSEARVADYVVLLSGRVVAAGTPDEVVTTEHLAAAYGPSLMHLEEGQIFLDDPAHQPVPGRHVHRRSVLPDAPEDDHLD
ncbi:MAG: metal ABC transporter ATP-binding protein [Acidimicrobiia bacterium]|nr:metal ABC transporter ATP-binding protein [Acidimicrobiia bacterium]NNL70384.1 metal ABC transporter ATP-binding protein [Acidimicrobiia bacterium]